MDPHRAVPSTLTAGSAPGTMTDEMNTFLELLPQYIQALAIVAAGLWAYWQFIYQRKKEPATDIDVDLRFVGQQDKAWIIEVTCVLVNKSLVRHTYRNFRVTVRYLTAADKIVDGSKDIEHQLRVPMTIDKRLDSREDRKTRRFFAGVADAEENENYINPGQQFHQRYVTWVPDDATFVWVQCKFSYDVGRATPQKTNTQKIFRVPTSPTNPSVTSV
jgi:hypothetical protein